MQSLLQVLFTAFTTIGQVPPLQMRMFTLKTFTTKSEINPFSGYLWQKE